MQKDCREMAELSLKLHKLTSAPEPGLWTWAEFVRDTALELNAIFQRYLPTLWNPQTMTRADSYNLARLRRAQRKERLLCLIMGTALAASTAALVILSILALTH